ncbi:MAG: TlyA family RNA methyltransferase [Dethiobacter sp.]|jgi:23S rRNA (cytidine1920-2'-O)/16S rRNA (cytidine1409-2'-O)-methyltransferase|nr:MAG: TlyA family RNA methyltransferase [Dethiobacter sp.]
MAGGKEKKRLDVLLIENKLVVTRSRARAEIMAGNVFVDGKKKDKPGDVVSSGATIELRGNKNPYVSRGGLKLKKALEEFAVNLAGKIVLDIGASTGGFTHCSLEHGAGKVYALDVGYGQLAWELRNDPRVISMERINVRNLKKEDLSERPDLATIDVSFISLRKVFPVVASLSIKEVICLVKPQFEAAPGQVGKKGVIRDIAVHQEVLRGVVKAAQDLSYTVKGLTYSPVKGPQGNIEFFLYLVKNGEEKQAEQEKEKDCRVLINDVVFQAHSFL